MHARRLEVPRIGRLSKEAWGLGAASKGPCPRGRGTVPVVRGVQTEGVSDGATPLSLGSSDPGPPADLELGWGLGGM